MGSILHRVGGSLWMNLLRLTPERQGDSNVPLRLRFRNRILSIPPVLHFNGN